MKTILQCDILQEVDMYKLTTRWFAKWAKKQNLTKPMLLKSIKDLEENLSTSNLGNGIFKVRVSKKGSGKSSSFRTIVIYSKDDRVVMVYGFAKSKKDNLTKGELSHFKDFAKEVLCLSDEELRFMIEQKEFLEIGENYEK